MQPLFLKKKTQSYDHSFQLQHVRVPHMYDKWHYHYEIELNLALNGSGTRYVGDSIQSFKGPDLVLVGAELPHVWKNDEIYYEGRKDLKVEVINFFFLPDFAGKDFVNLPEVKPVRKLFEDARRGLKFSGKTRELVVEKMQHLVRQDEGRRFFELLDILYYLAESEERVPLASPGFISTPKDRDLDKINKVYDYVIHNFKQKISLEDVADLANMTVAAFCRYFKNTTRKTLVQYINEIRTGYACKLLLDDQLTIAQICFESGFNNLSNFNRKFKSITGYSPKDYKQKHLKSKSESVVDPV